MSDTDDDEAFVWEGDERRAQPGPAPRLVDDRETDTGRPLRSGGSFALLAIGVLGGIAVLETAFWVRSATQLQIAASLDPGAGSPAEIAALVANVAGRVLAVAAPLVWFGVVTWLVAVPSRRLAWLALGAVLLVPWPAVLAAT